MNKRLLLFIISIISLIFLLTFIAPWSDTNLTDESAEKTELYVLSASSLTEVMKEQELKFESTHPTIDLIISYASSGNLQKQIEQGSPADLFLSAGVKQMEALKSENLIKNSTLLLTNNIVLINNRKSPAISKVKDLSLPKVETIALGYPKTVPAGKYTKQTLNTMGLWEELEPKFVYANSVQQVVTYVETGNVEAGFVYQTDLNHLSQNTTLIQKIDTKWHDLIQYPIGIVAGTENSAASNTFYDWLQSETAEQIFKTYGFQMNDQDGTQ